MEGRHCELWERKLQPFERSIHPCIHLQGWMFVWPVDPVRGRHVHNGLRMAYWEWYTFAISVANVSKGAAIVTSRSRSLLLSGQTSDMDSDKWFTIFSWWNANVCCFNFPGLDLFSHEDPSGEPMLRSGLQGWESYLKSVIHDRLLAWKNSAYAVQQHNHSHDLDGWVRSFVSSSVRIWYMNLSVVMRSGAKNSS